MMKHWIFITGLLALLTLSACTLGAVPTPTVDSNLIYTQAAQTVSAAMTAQAGDAQPPEATPTPPAAEASPTPVEASPTNEATLAPTELVAATSTPEPSITPTLGVSPTTTPINNPGELIGTINKPDDNVNLGG